MSKPVPLSNLDSAKRRVRTSGVDRALQILDWLQRQQHPATSYEVAKGVGAPLSTIYSVVDDLVAKNLLERQEDGTVWLGARLYHMPATSIC